MSVPSDCIVNVPPPNARHSPRRVFENLYSRTSPLTDPRVISQVHWTAVLLRLPQTFPSVQPEGMLTMMSSLRLTSSVKLIVPDHVPAKRSAGFADAAGVQAVINIMATTINGWNKRSVNTLLSFF